MRDGSRQLQEDHVEWSFVSEQNPEMTTNHSHGDRELNKDAFLKRNDTDKAASKQLRWLEIRQTTSFNENEAWRALTNDLKTTRKDNLAALPLSWVYKISRAEAVRLQSETIA